MVLLKPVPTRYRLFRAQTPHPERLKPFLIYDEIGMVRHKVKLEGNGVELEHSELEFNVVVDEYLVGSKTGLTLSDGEAVLGFVGIPEGVDSEDGGGLLFTTKDGELHARTLLPASLYPETP